MTRALLAAAAIGTLTGVALTFGPHGAIGIAVCAAGVIAFYGVRVVPAHHKRRMRRYREQVWVRRMADLKPWPIGDDEVRR